MTKTLDILDECANGLPVPTMPVSSTEPRGRRRNSLVKTIRKFSVGTIGLIKTKAVEEEDLISARDVSRARNRVQDYIHQTQVLTSSNLNSMLKVKVLFKAENFQKSGSYQVRGLLNHIVYLREQRLQMRAKTRKSSLPQSLTVLTYTPGDFAEAAACAASMVGVNCISIVPKSTCRATLEILRHYKATVLVNSSDSSGTLAHKAEKEAQANGYKIIYPYDTTIIAGYGTLASDFMKQTNNSLEAVLVVAGDGCLAAATAITIKEIDDETDVYLVTQPDDPLQIVMATSTWPDDDVCVDRATQSIAPALNLTTHPSTHSALMRHCEKSILAVDNNAISDAMRFMFERLKVVVDENASACVAALFSEQFMYLCQVKQYRRVGVMLTGGNCELVNLPFVKGNHDITKCRNVQM